jgi:glycosyltransferase involved in cell wall biosynthesis
MNNNIKIIGGLLVRNEEHRWLRLFLESFKLICDEVVVVDDASTDRTVDICYEFGCDIHSSLKSGFEENEYIPRLRLWNLCVRKAKINDIIIILDADEIIDQIEALKFRHYLLEADIKNESFALALFDMWNEKQYRSDLLWTAHTRAWAIATRYKPGIYNFAKNKLHCGRLPLEVIYKNVLFFKDIRIKHLGWSTKIDRQFKYDRYMRLDSEFIFGIKAQYDSILDENPNLLNYENVENANHLDIEEFKEAYKNSNKAGGTIE